MASRPKWDRWPFDTTWDTLSIEQQKRQESGERSASRVVDLNVKIRELPTICCFFNYLESKLKMRKEDKRMRKKGVK